ncbi:MAG: hypothetical protein CMH83_22575 [Nocardioides sp.]|nr:hypothetical protein [Nocardioides sp.]
MEINGLPVHALVVHAAVVFAPLAGIAGILYALVQKWRDWLRWPLVATSAIALVTIWVAVLSGESVLEANTYGGEVGDLVHEHEEHAEQLRIAGTVFALVAFVAAWFHTRTGPVKIVLQVLLVLSGLATIGLTVLAGDYGAQVGWFGING